LVFRCHACEHLIAGTKCLNKFCRTEKRSWSWLGGSCGLPLRLGGLGEHTLCPVYVVLWSGHLEPWMKCDPAIEPTTDILVYETHVSCIINLLIYKYF
jgi:hypothetical protein